MRKYACLLACIGFLVVPVDRASAVSLVNFTFTATLHTPPLGGAVMFPANSGYIIMASATCVDSVANANSPQPPASTGNCSFNFTGWIGPNEFGGAWCGVAAGRVGGFYTDSGGQQIGVVFDFRIGGQAFVANGNASKGNESGTISINAKALPPNGGLGAGSCLTGTATTFSMAGTGHINVA